MRAVVARCSATASESLVDVELSCPVATGRDLLVDVRAVSVNPVDVKVRRALSPAAPPRVLGWDAAGVVVGRGDAATGFAVGDEVWFAGDIGRPGSNAELCLVDERIAACKPRGLTFAAAAALPLTALTAYEAFFDRMHVPRGEGGRGANLLVVGAAGGVGSIAVQLAKALTGATVIGTASRPESARWVHELGADLVVDHHGDLRAQLADRGIAHVDYILCTADTDPYAAALCDLVAPQGVVCFIVPPTRPIDLAPLHAKSAAIAWELMFTRSRFATADLAAQGQILAEVAALVDAGRLRSTMTACLHPLDADTLRDAHARIETGATIGKVVVVRR